MANVTEVSTFVANHKSDGLSQQYRRGWTKIHPLFFAKNTCGGAITSLILCCSPLSFRTAMTSAPAKAKKPQTQQFYEAVNREFARLNSVRKNGVKLYSEEYIIATLAGKFFRAEKTILNIVYGRV